MRLKSIAVFISTLFLILLTLHIFTNTNTLAQTTQNAITLLETKPWAAHYCENEVFAQVNCRPTQGGIIADTPRLITVENRSTLLLTNATTRPLHNGMFREKVLYKQTSLPKANAFKLIAHFRLDGTDPAGVAALEFAINFFRNGTHYDAELQRVTDAGGLAEWRILNRLRQANGTYEGTWVSTGKTASRNLSEWQRLELVASIVNGKLRYDHINVEGVTCGLDQIVEGSRTGIPSNWESNIHVQLNASRTPKPPIRLLLRDMSIQWSPTVGAFALSPKPAKCAPPLVISQLKDGEVLPAGRPVIVRETSTGISPWETWIWWTGSSERQLQFGSGADGRVNFRRDGWTSNGQGEWPSMASDACREAKARRADGWKVHLLYGGREISIPLNCEGWKP